MVHASWQQCCYLRFWITEAKPPQKIQWMAYKWLYYWQCYNEPGQNNNELIVFSDIWPQNFCWFIELFVLALFCVLHLFSSLWKIRPRNKHFWWKETGSSPSVYFNYILLGIVNFVFVFQWKQLPFLINTGLFLTRFTTINIRVSFFLVHRIVPFPPTFAKKRIYRYFNVHRTCW